MGMFEEKLARFGYTVEKAIGLNTTSITNADLQLALLYDIKSLLQELIG